MEISLIATITSVTIFCWPQTAAYRPCPALLRNVAVHSPLARPAVRHQVAAERGPAGRDLNIDLQAAQVCPHILAPSKVHRMSGVGTAQVFERNRGMVGTPPGVHVESVLNQLALWIQRSRTLRQRWKPSREIP